mmetsp:Transcript_66089/g.158078  ORF Transcript_66089/g.158078 Transcript_66089/m.158078 type:complete len:255 (-) Transcript_66089:1724-2488(-)
MIHISHLYLGETWNSVGAVFVLFDVQLLAGLAKEVLNRLIVDLGDHEGDLDFSIKLAVLLYSKQLSQYPSIQTRVLLCTGHGVRLPGSCLAIGEDTDVVAIQHRGCQWLHLLEDLRLRSLRLEGSIEFEPLPPPIRLFEYGNFPLLGEGDGRIGRLGSLLFLVDRSNSHEHPDVALQLHHEVVQLLPLIRQLPISLHKVVIRAPHLFHLSTQWKERVGDATHLDVGISFDLLLPRPQADDLLLHTLELLEQALG